MRAAWIFALTTTLHASVVLHPPPPYFENAAQDAKGILWAYSRAEYNHIYSFDGHGWTEQFGPSNLPKPAMPTFVVRMTDGAMACVWALDHTVAVTRHTTAGGTLIGQCDGKIAGTGLHIQPLSDSQNRLWITNEGPDIYRADFSGVKLIHRFTPEEYVSPNPHPQGYNAVHAVEDGMGRVWVWSDPHASNYASLRGVLIFTGDTAEMHPSFGSIQGSRILAIARADDRHMWMSVANDGIYLVDIGTFAFKRETDPAPKAFCCVHELHMNGSDLFAVEETPPFKCALWRRHAGTWTKVVESIGVYPFLPRSWLAVPQGILVEGDDNSAWFLPPGGQGMALNWQSGFPLSRAQAFARLPNGDIFALGNNDKIFDGPLALPPRDSNNSRLVWVAAERGWKLDSRGGIWAILKATPTLLSQWNGDQWIGHTLPIPFSANQMPTMEGDLRGQMWVEAPEANGSVEIYDPKADHWQTFASLNAAYLAMGHQPPQFIENGTLDHQGPVYSPDLKRVAYRGGAAYIYYYDGTKWTHFGRWGITGNNQDNAVGPPFFDNSGALLVNLRPHLSYRMDISGKWTQIPFHSLYPDDIWSEEGHHRGNPFRQTPPEGAITRNPDFCIKDNVGTWWLTWKGQLYRAVPGICVAEFGPDEVNPFTSHSLLNKVVVDKNGNALFPTGSETDPFLMLRPKGHPPHTVVTLQRAGPDSFIAHLDPKTAGNAIFRWQLDNSDWQQGSNRDLSLDHLPNGTHTLSVLAMTQNLDIQVAPTVSTFETQIDASSQIDALILQLHDPDYDRRKAAVAALARQPDRALPALRQALANASGDNRWWLEVALQEVEQPISKSR